MNFGANELTQCAETEVKRETAKELLEQMDAILKELNNEVRMISEAVYRDADCTNIREELDEPKMPPMIVIMEEQRDMAEEILKEVFKIRESLWR